MPRTPDPKPAEKESSLVPSGFFVLRTPLLPFDELLAWTEGLSAERAQSDMLVEAVTADRRRLRAGLSALTARAEVREALFLASPSLEESLALWLKDPESERGQKVERTLV